MLLKALWASGGNRELEGYAARRLSRLCLDPGLRQDLVNEAAHTVLKGLEEGGSGRHPRREDLCDLVSFLRYMKQAVRSIAANIGRHERCLVFLRLGVHGSFGEHSGMLADWEPPAPPSAESDPVMKDLRHELFRRMRKQAPPRLRRIVKAWEREFVWTDKIPIDGGHRQYRAEVRKLAQKILLEMGEMF